MKTKTLVTQIARFYKNYEFEFLKERIRDKNDYLESPKSALFFVLSYSFIKAEGTKYHQCLKKEPEQQLNLYWGIIMSCFIVHQG